MTYITLHFLFNNRGLNLINQHPVPSSVRKKLEELEVSDFCALNYKFPRDYIELTIGFGVPAIASCPNSPTSVC